MLTTEKVTTEKVTNIQINNSLKNNYIIIKPIIPQNLYPQPITNIHYASQKIKLSEYGCHLLESMMVTSNNILIKLLNKLGYVNFKGNRAELINLLWWITILRKSKKLKFNKKDNIKLPLLKLRLSDNDISTVMNLNLTKLQELCTPSNHNINTNFDRITCIFILCTGYVPPTYLYDSSYIDMYLNMNSLDIMRLSKYLYNFYGNNGNNSRIIEKEYENNNYIMSPYHWLAHNKVLLKGFNKYLIDINNQNVKNFIEELGMVIPSNILNNKDNGYSVLMYYFNNIKYYQNIDNARSIDINNIVASGIYEYLIKFKDTYILNYFGVHILEWNSRPEMLNILIKEITNQSDHWFIRININNNNNKHFTLSYGTYLNYKDYDINTIIDIMEN